jgi:hypothetical protein
MITISKDEQESRIGKSKAHAIANEIFEYADERVGHAEEVPKEELILACYERLSNLLGQWARKLDKLEKVNNEPAWLRKIVQKKELMDKRPLISYDSASLGFRVENLFFARERDMSQGQTRLSDDTMLVSEPSSMLTEDFKNLLAFCEENELEFYVDGFGSKEPGRTFRLAIYSPKLAVKSQMELREKIILALKIFSELSNTPTGKKQAVKRRTLISELEKTGQFDETLATKIVEVIIAGKLVPQGLLD